VTARLGRTMATTLSSTFHSFAYGLVRRYAPAEIYAAPLRLLSAPEQDVVLRELLTDHPESVVWPDSLSRALGTRGFAREVNAVLSRAREKGHDGADLRALGAEHDLPEFLAAGLFLEQYLDNLDSVGATDYADLIRRATIEAAEHRDELRARFRYVFVDEYQDTDPGQVALLRQLAGDGGNLTVVGDPHQSIYGFRGAEVRGILDFPDQFRNRAGSRAEVIALRTTRRFGPRLLVASQRVASRLALPGSIPESAKAAFLDPVAAEGPHGPGRVVVRTFDTERAEAEHLADLLRRAHLEDGIAWDDMAVLVRSGRSTIPPLRRALGAAGVPVEVASDEVPLVRDPAVLPLLDAVRAVVNLDNSDVEHVDYLHASRVESLLLSPLGGLDAGDLRRLARQLRARAKAVAHEAKEAPPSSRDLVRLAVVEAGFLDGLSGPEINLARGLAELLGSARASLDAGSSAEEVLWLLWSSTGWPERLRRVAEAGGAAARRAHRDLDSVVALFEAVARAEEQRVHVSVASLFATLSAQQIPADTLAERGARGAAVRLLTAHRSKGLEWRLVVVAHAQQEAWPDLRRRSTLLQADRIGSDGLVPPVSARELLLEERRLFYVACTRARERLVVTAVKSPDDDGEQPSRFLDELGVSDVQHVVGRPIRPLSMAGLVAELRRHVTDPDTAEPLRRAAARRLARLAGEVIGDAGTRRLVPQADPSTWWGTRAASYSTEPLRAPDQPVPVSASVLERLMVCPTAWFLEREAGGVARAHQSANLGQIVHALAERVATGELDAGIDDVDVLMRHVDDVWDRLEFRTPWSKAREHERTRAALAKFLRWHHTNTRTLLGTEQQFSAVVVVTDDSGADVPVRLTGYADRLELDGEGRVVVVDLKTGRTKLSKGQVEAHVQLGLYQYAVDAGAIDASLPEGAAVVSGGAELVQLGLPDDSVAPVVQTQDPHPDGGLSRTGLRLSLARAADLLRTESFPAVSGAHCRDCSFVPICPVKSAGSVTGP
ncbi:MAG: ATP-dependent DNA helicase, partial [Nocardioides sp.]